MLKSDLEEALLEINKKLDNGVKLVIKEYRGKDALIYGFVAGAAFAVGDLVVKGIKNEYVRQKNIEWVKAHKGKWGQ